MIPVTQDLHHGQRVRFTGNTPYPKGIPGTVVLTDGVFATRHLARVLWDPDATGFNHGTQSVAKDLLDLIPATEAILTEVTPTPTAPLIQE